jgi:hypothetical protein
VPCEGLLLKLPLPTAMEPAIAPIYPLCPSCLSLSLSFRVPSAGAALSRVAAWRARAPGRRKEVPVQRAMSSVQAPVL